MEKKPKKLIIVGAGASAELDYPTGGELILLFKRYLNQTNNTELLQYFNTEPISVDRLISHISNDEHQAKIKQILMFLISMCEKQWELKSAMYHNIISGLLVFENDEWQLNEDIDILTFNYDVSLDIYCRDYIQQTICGNQNPSQEQIQKAIALQTALREKITHIYGSLWDKKDEGYEYGKKLNDFWDYVYYSTNRNIQKNLQNNYFKKIEGVSIDANNNIGSHGIFTNCGFLPFRKSQQNRKNFVEERQWDNNIDINNCKYIEVDNHQVSKFYNNEHYNIYINKLIQTIAYERAGDGKNSEYDKYKEKVKEADIIYIMGFGFDKFNCENVLGFDEIKQSSINKKIFYTNHNNIPVVNRIVKYYFGDGENVVKSTLGCSETMGREFNFDSEI